MAVTATLLTEGVFEGNFSSQNTASVSPGANKLILLAVSSNHGGGNNTAVSSVTGCGLTWVEVATELDSSNGENRTTLFRAMGASPSSGAITINYAGGNQIQCLWSVTEFGGVDISGTNGSGAIVQADSDDTTSQGNNATAEVDLATITITNATFGVYAQRNASSDLTPGSGFTQLGTERFADDDSFTECRQFVEWSSTGTDPVLVTRGASTWTMVAVEIRSGVYPRPVVRRLQAITRSSVM